jgi:cardiolipin synthase A/B
MMEILHNLKPVWHWIVLTLDVCVVVMAMGHVLLSQRDARSAGFWAAIICFVPIMGAIAYALFGINSLRRKGQEYRAAAELDRSIVGETCPVNPWESMPELQELRGLALTLARISRLEFTIGNQIKVLHSGDEAMPAMLDAIRHSQVSIALCSYIFEAKGIGADFVDELAKAKERGVEVRVMVDDAGTKYSFPPVTRILRKRGVIAKRYMPLRFVLRLLTMNLRNHRKIMVVDGKIGFTGGMNIRQGNMLAANPDHPVQDMHFQVEGPVVRQLQRMFAEDWAFCANEVLSGDKWYPPLAPLGQVAALGVPDGPDEDMEQMPKVIFAALNAAKREVNIMTPYFLPDNRLIWAMTLAALRGVKVNVITPQKNNIPFVRWAAHTIYPQLIEKKVKVYESTGHFDHSKFMTVDGLWSLIGSTNWDPRSLRLNFEFNLACFDDLLAAELNQHFNSKLPEAHLMTLKELSSASLPVRLRNGFVRLFIPML